MKSEGNQYYILGDWGTSSCRLYLCDDGKIIAQAAAKGAKFTDNLEEEYISAVQAWADEHGPLDAVICGMAGSNIGWIETGYISCPAKADDILENIKSIQLSMGQVHILPGVNTKNNLAELHDVMRGEATQIYGCMAGLPGDALICLPGTHTKWALTSPGKINNFLTSFTGELFETLKLHSILIGAQNLPQVEQDDAFFEGVEIGAKQVGLSHILFSVRSNQIFVNYTASESQNYLLGLLIGHDVTSAKSIFEKYPDVIIGGDGPASFYQAAMSHLGGVSKILSGQHASFSGLQKVYNALKSRM